MMGRYGRDFDRGGWRGHDMANREGFENRGWNRYDAGYQRQYGSGRGYDQGYRGSAEREKSDWRTQYGDPYGDRSRHTPIQVTRGEFEGNRGRYGASGYDRTFRRGYDTGYRRNRYDRSW